VDPKHCTIWRFRVEQTGDDHTNVVITDLAEFLKYLLNDGMAPEGESLRRRQGSGDVMIIVGLE
jgi:hypothetical protein